MNKLESDQSTEYHASQHPCPTIIQGSGIITLLHSGDRVTFSTTGTNNVRRNAVITTLTNIPAPYGQDIVGLSVVDGAGRLASVIYSYSSFSFESGDDFVLRNDTPAAISLCVLEYFISRDVVVAAKVIAKGK